MDVLCGIIPFLASSSFFTVTWSAERLADDGPGQDTVISDFSFKLKERQGFSTMVDDSLSLYPYLKEVPTLTHFKSAICAHAHKYYKTIKVWFFHVLFDLAVLPSSLATRKQSTWPLACALF